MNIFFILAENSTKPEIRPWVWILSALHTSFLAKCLQHTTTQPGMQCHNGPDSQEHRSPRALWQITIVSRQTSWSLSLKRHYCFGQTLANSGVRKRVTSLSCCCPLPSAAKGQLWTAGRSYQNKEQEVKGFTLGNILKIKHFKNFSKHHFTTYKYISSHIHTTLEIKNKAINTVSSSCFVTRIVLLYWYCKKWKSTTQCHFKSSGRAPMN